MTDQHRLHAGPSAHSRGSGATSGASSFPRADGVASLPAWLQRPVRRWGVSRSPDPWLAGVLSGTAARHGVDPLLLRGAFVAACVLSAGLALLAYAVAWVVLPDAEGRVQYARLADGDWSGPGIGVAAVGGAGVVSLLTGVGPAVSVLAGGSVLGLAGLAAIGLVAWWIATGWDPRTQRPGRRRGSPPSSPAAPRSESDGRDEHGFPDDWIDPLTGSWRDVPTSRDRRAERWAQDDAPPVRGARRSARPRQARPAVAAVAQAIALAAAGLAAALGLFTSTATSWDVYLFGNAQLATTPLLMAAGAALLILVPVQLAVAGSGRRARLVTIGSGAAVAVVAGSLALDVLLALS